MSIFRVTALTTSGFGVIEIAPGGIEVMISRHRSAAAARQWLAEHVKPMSPDDSSEPPLTG